MTRPIPQPPVFGRPARAVGLWRATPPAIFPPILGLFGLGLAWRRGADVLGLPGGISEAMLGAVSLLFWFAVLAYLAKVVRRPGVVVEDIAILPGRAGIAAASLALTLQAATLVPYAPGLAFALALVGLGTHIALAAYLIRFFLTGAPERRVVTPVWHLSFVGFILGPLVWIPLGQNVLAVSILAMTLPIAFAIWTASALQFMRRVPPAPLRPLLAIHLAPASLFAIVLSDLGLPDYAGGFAALAIAILLLLAVGLRWMTETGFSAMWGAFTFPLAACTSAVLAQGWALPGAMLLVVASAAVLHIAIKVMKSWADGGLAAKSNAAVA